VSNTPIPSPGPAPARGGRIARLRQLVGSWVSALSTRSRALSDDTVTALGERVDQLVERVVHHPSPVVTRDELAEALESVRSNKTGAASIATLLTATRMARRTVSIGARRIPVLAAATGTATALATFAGGFRELRMLASHLVHRARFEGVEVTPTALRTVTLQLYLRPGEAPRVDTPPTLLLPRIASRWVRTAAAEVLPLVPTSLSRPSVDKLVDAAAAVDVTLLSKG
jgi:hypothetical protein